ncbi:hypothetical protein BD626DRAFT_490783 [Schizophyllum amplum]|uniref:Uncharacterized protein n=1 Tax=Schizophyllum amplum TaxID=97359 RepID=A0A550CJS5_9AGAR|nr:hypothetical protein BD626DRAFT_490783 [Auriculariopsis ampla]
MTYLEVKIPACLPGFAFIYPMTSSMTSMQMTSGTLFEPDLHNAQKLVPKPASDAMHAIINLAAHGQTLAQAFCGLSDAVRQVLLPETEGPLESYLDLIDVQYRVVLRCLDDIIVAVDITNATFYALEYATTIKLTRPMWGAEDFRELLPAIRKMREFIEALNVKTADMKSSAKDIPERLSLSELAEIRGDSEKNRRELDLCIRRVDAWYLQPMADEAQKLAKFARQYLSSPHISADQARQKALHRRPW